MTTGPLAKLSRHTHDQSERIEGMQVCDSLLTSIIIAADIVWCVSVSVCVCC